MITFDTGNSDFDNAVLALLNKGTDNPTNDNKESNESIKKKDNTSKKQTEKKQTRRNRRNGSKGKPLVADNVHKALLQCIKQCTNPHRYNHLFLRRSQQHPFSS